MRPRRGTELHGRKVFFVLIAFGVLCVIANLGRLLFESQSTLGAISAVVLIAVGAQAVWRGGYMLEWWGPPEPR